MPWPPPIEYLENRNQELPPKLTNFVQMVLKSSNCPRSEKVNCITLSFSQDLVHGITRGRVMTLKRFLLGLGLHNITGQKLPVRIVSNLGHCIDYKSVCQIETAEAEVASMLYEEGTSPGLKPLTEDDKVLTYFWADNFNKKIDSKKVPS